MTMMIKSPSRWKEAQFENRVAQVGLENIFKRKGDDHDNRFEKSQLLFFLSNLKLIVKITLPNMPKLHKSQGIQFTFNIIQLNL